MRVWFVLLVACSQPVTDPSPNTSCEGLFGHPNDNTGLDESQCSDDVDPMWSPKTWTADDIAALRAWILVDPPAAPESDPYEVPAPEQAPGQVCSVDVQRRSEQTYRLVTAASADAAPGPITHGGACGLCSSLEDLAVYAENGDLTEPVRQCGLRSLGGDVGDTEDCLRDLGFTAPCARIWAYNTLHTRQECLEPCLSALNEPYHTPDGELNDCLQCDEDVSGAVFKAVAGRTRRNSGLATALCRPCATVWRIEHGY